MDFKVTRDDSYLEHHGVLGMKWGIRRLSRASSASKKDAQNLRENGYEKEADAVQKVSDENYRKAQNKAGKLYEKEMKKATNHISRTATGRSIKAYNMTAKQYNEHRETNAGNSRADQDRYAKQFNKDMSVNYNNMMYEDLSQNKHYQRATNLYKQYSLHKVNTLARRNQKYHDEVDRYLKSKGL